VDYELTALGRTLLPVVRAIKDWSETHIAEVHAARDAYDLMAPGT
jgi:DNA-binding HxlR family transcriptional regulator